MIRSSKFQSSVGCAGSLIGSLKLQAARKHRTQHLHCKPLGRAGDGNPRRILHRILHHILQKILQKNSSGRSARNGQRYVNMFLHFSTIFGRLEGRASGRLDHGAYSY